MNKLKIAVPVDSNARKISEQTIFRTPMLRTLTLSALFLCILQLAQAQITIINNSNKNFTHFYITDADSSLRTTTICDYIQNKNLLKQTLQSKQQVKIAILLKPTRFYNIVCLDTSEFPNNYSSIAFKYHVSGSTKSIVIENANVESDFSGHCMEGAMDYAFEDLDLNIQNNSTGNIIKIYFKFKEEEKFRRCSDFAQWNPIRKKSFRKLTFYNNKPIEADTIFIKYYTETAGVIKEYVIQKQLSPGQRSLSIEVK